MISSLEMIYLTFNDVPKGELVRALGGAVASSSLLGVPLGHNSSFLQGPAFAPPRIREAIWCGSTNSTTEEGSHNTLLLDYYLTSIQKDLFACFKNIFLTEK